MNLKDVTFLVVDVETTGGSSKTADITEIGAVKVRGGEVLDQFQTLINPGYPIPPYISLLTGITDSMVADAPALAPALESFLNFAGNFADLVIVAHNAPFDLSFLRTAAIKVKRSWPDFLVLDTVKLARTVLDKNDVPDFKLSTLARFFNSSVSPQHRALADAQATVDLLHGVIERFGSLGVETLEELRTFSHSLTKAQREKKNLASEIPALPGIYIFQNKSGDALYVGTSQNLKLRVQSYFTGSQRNKRMLEMINQTIKVEAITTPTVIEARIAELRLINQLQPPFNRRSKSQSKVRWITFSSNRPSKVRIVRSEKKISEGEPWIGPITSRVEAELVKEAIELCSLINSEEKAESSDSAHFLDSLHLDITRATHPLERKMKMLSGDERFEEALAIRDRLSALVKACYRAENIRSLTVIPRIIAAAPQENHLYEVAFISYGRLISSLRTDRLDLPLLLSSFDYEIQPKLESQILPDSTHAEVEELSSFLNSGVILLHIEGSWVNLRNGALSRHLEFKEREKIKAEPILQ